MEKKNEEQSNQSMSIQEKGRQFLKKFQEIPYDNSRVGKSFVILPVPHSTEAQSSKTSQPENNPQSRPATTKTAEEILKADPKSLTVLEQIIQELMLYKGMTLEQAIDALDELP